MPAMPAPGSARPRLLLWQKAAWEYRSTLTDINCTVLHRGHIRCDGKKVPKAHFKPRELKKLFEDEWYVDAEWPDGTIERMAGPFASNSEARDWITHKSRKWLDSKEV